ncbi:hypothetical protein F7725_004113 [Dissostichus mawsoni]|uniref:Uncharacterized protein n=1 Tax=Dissostichus mawsoni TaxID=36200 RepID=A0A7J5YC94_DISMA|nr:hypothetical protein F7725_004113 [Dissostichus mawsoni]
MFAYKNPAVDRWAFESEVLRLLEPLVQVLQLQAGVDGSGLPDLLPLPVHTQLLQTLMTRDPLLRV